MRTRGDAKCVSVHRAQEERQPVTSARSEQPRAAALPAAPRRGRPGTVGKPGAHTGRDPGLCLLKLPGDASTAKNQQTALINECWGHRAPTWEKADAPCHGHREPQLGYGTTQETQSLS